MEKGETIPKYLTKFTQCWDELGIIGIMVAEEEIDAAGGVRWCYTSPREARGLRGIGRLCRHEFHGKQDHDDSVSEVHVCFLVVSHLAPHAEK